MSLRTVQHLIKRPLMATDHVTRCGASTSTQRQPANSDSSSPTYSGEYVQWQDRTSLIAIGFLVDAPPPLGFEDYRSSRTVLRRTVGLNWVGAALTLGAVTRLVLGQSGGNCVTAM
ncbi:hypothetical protein AURDEDRAFT_110736 [Auricularia subglabra TFB-10046 SS5]|nr:hypothetical protein AURDEDRAFT_110736 [Auricularia subglabra TFB-10046 SS5]